MIENLGHISRYTPNNGKGRPIYKEWLVLIDTVNKTLQWREHWVVQRMPIEKKKRLEKRILKDFKGFKWFSQYQAIYKGEPSSEIMWSTSKKEASKMFKMMDIKNDKIEKI